ncbi:MAG: PIN domain-containing protein [Gemmatimonadetes bacterium]|nr:PIN domain-containing protein [Candidatus Palauibacter rhopaloidicola]
MFIDTNILVSARFQTAPHWSLASAALDALINGAEALHVSRQILREYLAAVTRPQTWSDPVSMTDALRDLERMPRFFQILEDGPGVTRTLAGLLRDVPVAGRQVHDANIVATMLTHGEHRLLTLNRKDFSRFGHVLELVPIDEAGAG